MTEVITQTRTEIAVAHTLQFLESERGAGLDGDFASRSVTEQVRPVQEVTEAFLTANPIPKQDGFYMPLGKHNAHQYGQAVNVLPGHMVLVPSAMVERGAHSAFYPAVVSPDGQKENVIRLHVLRQPYHVQRGLGHGAATVLSAAGQSEVAGVGQHGRLQGGDGIEAEHFATLLAAGSDPQVQAAWKAGMHINHVWREQANNSVTTAVSQRLFGKDIPQTTITITQPQVAEGKAMLLWHESLRDGHGTPESATRPGALQIVQALGYEALRANNPQGINTLKRMISS